MTRTRKFFEVLFTLCLSFYMFELSSNAKTLVYGHRGARALYPESTMTGYKYSIELGVDYIDMDVALTKDKILVVTHDLSLSPKIVSDLSGMFIPENYKNPDEILLKNILYKDLKKFNVGRINPNLSYSKLFPLQKNLDFEHIPKLEDVIDLALNKKTNAVNFQIEIKTNPQNPDETFSNKIIAQTVSHFLKQKNIINRTEIQAFDWGVLYELQKIDPNIKTAFLTSRTTLNELNSLDKKQRTLWTGGKDFVSYNNCIQCMIKESGGALWDPEDTEVTKDNLNKAHALGLKVVAWTWPEKSNSFYDQKMIEKLINLGIDGIITDDPARLISYLKSINH